MPLLGAAEQVPFFYQSRLWILLKIIMIERVASNEAYDNRGNSLLGADFDVVQAPRGGK
jgi:hypothetical protein